MNMLVPGAVLPNWALQLQSRTGSRQSYEPKQHKALKRHIRDLLPRQMPTRLVLFARVTLGAAAQRAVGFGKGLHPFASLRVTDTGELTKIMPPLWALLF